MRPGTAVGKVFNIRRNLKKVIMSQFGVLGTELNVNLIRTLLTYCCSLLRNSELKLCIIFSSTGGMDVNQIISLHCNGVKELTELFRNSNSNIIPKIN